MPASRTVAEPCRRPWGRIEIHLGQARAKKRERDQAACNQERDCFNLLQVEGYGRIQQILTRGVYAYAEQQKQANDYKFDSPPHRPYRSAKRAFEVCEN